MKRGRNELSRRQKRGKEKEGCWKEVAEGRKDKRVKSKEQRKKTKVRDAGRRMDRNDKRKER